MIIEYTKGLDTQYLYAQGNELVNIMGRDRDINGKRIHTLPASERQLVHAFKHPVLITDKVRIARLEDVAVREALFRLFEQPAITTTYNNTAFTFIQSDVPSVWGPSIDTLLFAKGLSMCDLSNLSRAVEFGAGSGFLSKYLLDHAPNLGKMTMIDINPEAKYSWFRHINSPRVDPFIGDARAVTDGAWDLVIANPPYVPRPVSSDDNPYEGLSMYEHLFTHYDTLVAPQGRMITNISSLSAAQVNAWMRNAGLRGRPLASLEVPLKVCNILNNPDWIDFLKQNGMKEEMRQGYPYWQTITITDVVRA